VRRTYPELFAAAGREVRIGTQRPTYVADNAADAAQAAEEARWHARVSRSLRYQQERIENGIVEARPLEYEPETGLILDEFVVAGTPDRCIHQLRRIESGLGVDYFNCSVWIGDLPQDKVLRSMALFAREVMPAFRADHRIGQMETA